MSLVILRKVFGFRMEPTPAQGERLARNAGCRRWIWNWALGRKKSFYRQCGVGFPTRVLKAELPLLKLQGETAWLKDADSQRLQESLRDLDRAFKNFFEKRARFPRFKSRKRDEARFRVSQRVTIADGIVSIPKIASVRIRQSQPVTGEPKSTTFKRDATGHWNVALVTEFTMPDAAIPPDSGGVVGVDLGLKDFAVLSDGGRIEAPKLYRRAQRKLRLTRRMVVRRKPHGRNGAKAQQRAARIQAKTANRRKDFIHKVTTGLVRKYEGICIEDLSVKGLAKTKLAKSILDASFGEFRRELEYKSIWNRRHLAVIGRWYPSSKTCHQCDAVNDSLTLADRSWTCAGCGVRHDRDKNASLNIRAEGLKILAAGHAESKTHAVAGVRPPEVEAACA
jgi:putative transposase